MSEDVIKESFEVSAAHPDKVVVNGCDLVNRTDLSTSQNRELQRFIERNAHKLGFYDRPHDEKNDAPLEKYNSFSLNTSGKPYNYEGFDHGKGADYGNRTGSPFSEYGTGGKRKGVKFADRVDSSRARSHSPNGVDQLNQSANRNPVDNFGNGGQGRGGSGYGQDPYGQSGGAPGYGQITGQGLGQGDAGRWGEPDGRGGWKGADAGHGHGNDAKRAGNGYGNGRRAGSAQPAHADNYTRYRNQGPDRHSQQPADPFKWKPYQSYEYDGRKKTVQPPVPEWLRDREITPAYSALGKHPDNYNRYDTEKYRIKLSRQSQEKDEEIKFYGFGDRLGSGIELARKRWTGGEAVTDPNFIKKSIKPRTMFYSPIGDGVVAADGIELKRGPPDLNPRRFEYHQRVVEKGDYGQGGVRVTEKIWDEGNRGNGDGDDGGLGQRKWPDDGLGNGNGLGDGPGTGRRPANDDDGRGRGPGDGNGWPDDGHGPWNGPDGSGPGDGLGDGWPRGNGDPFGTLGSDGGYPKSMSPLSIGTDGFPREGWTKTFITNPRELINQYGTDTNTNIFDLLDHTPKTVTTVKETIISSPVPH